MGYLRGKYRLLYVVRPCSGGMLRHLLDLLRYLDRELFYPIVTGPPQGRLPETLAALDVEFIPLALNGKWHLWNLRCAQGELGRLLRAAAVQLVHTHGVQAGLAARRVAHLAGLTVVATAHNFIYSRPDPPWRKALLAAYQRRLVPFTDRYIAVCDGLARELQQVERVPAAKIVTIYNGVDLNRLEAAFAHTTDCRLPFAVDGPCIGTIARLIPEKGVDIFLRACALVGREEAKARFVVIGDGPWRHYLEDLAVNIGLEGRIFFLGQVEEAAALLPLLDVYVQPSRQEGFSLAVLEAMAAGRPVIATRAGGLVEALRPGENGYLVALGDWQGLARQVLSLLREPALARRLGQRGRELVVEQFGVTRMVQATQEVYHRLLEAKG